MGGHVLRQLHGGLPAVCLCASRAAPRRVVNLQIYWGLLSDIYETTRFLSLLLINKNMQQQHSAQGATAGPVNKACNSARSLPFILCGRSTHRGRSSVVAVTDRQTDHNAIACNFSHFLEQHCSREQAISCFMPSQTAPFRHNNTLICVFCY